MCRREPTPNPDRLHATQSPVAQPDDFRLRLGDAEVARIRAEIKAHTSGSLRTETKISASVSPSQESRESLTPFSTTI
jgi:hypothetical protein